MSETREKQPGIAYTDDFPNLETPTSLNNIGVLTGRKQILITDRDITPDKIKYILNYAIQIHNQNVKDINYLYKYYLGDQPILQRTKEVRPDICNKVVENHADEIVNFKVGYVFGENIVYAGRAESDCSDGIQKLNGWNSENNKEQQDAELGMWMYVCGQGYRIVLPNADAEMTSDEMETPYVTDVIDPREAFVVYYNGTPKVPVLGVKIVNVLPTPWNGGIQRTLYCCYTRNAYYEIYQDELGDLGSVPSYRLHNLGGVPIVEYPLNVPRRGAIEPVLPLLDAINNLTSNRLDGVEQFIQSIILFHNVDVDSKDVERLQKMGAIKYKDVEPSMPGDVRYITAELNQEGSQTLKQDLYDSVIIISGMPNRNDGNGDNGIAVVYRDGWSAAETKAKETEKFFTKSEREMLKIILRICRESGKEEIHLSNIEVKFTRKNFENTAAKATVLTQMLSNEKIAPRLAFVNSGMFSDPEAAYQESKEYYDSQPKEAVRGQSAPEEEEVVVDETETV